MTKTGVLQHTAVLYLDRVPEMPAEMGAVTHKQLIKASSLTSSVDLGQTTVSTLLDMYPSYVKQESLSFICV